MARDEAYRGEPGGPIAYMAIYLRVNSRRLQRETAQVQPVG